jgi:hypothetical protein
LRNNAQAFRAIHASVDSQVNARLLPLADYIKTLKKEGTVKRAGSNDFIPVCVSWRISSRGQIDG